MQAIILIILFLLILVYAPPFNFKFTVNGKEILIESSEINESESSD